MENREQRIFPGGINPMYKLNDMILRDSKRIAEQAVDEWKTFKELGVYLCAMDMSPAECAFIIEELHPGIEVRVLPIDRMDKEDCQFEARKRQ